MTSEPRATAAVAEPPSTPPPPEPRSGRRLSVGWVALLGLVVLLDIVAFVAFPQSPRDGAPGDTCAFPACFIENALEFPAPHTIVDLAPASAPSLSPTSIAH